MFCPRCRVKRIITCQQTVVVQVFLLVRTFLCSPVCTLLLYNKCSRKRRGFGGEDFSLVQPPSIAGSTLLSLLREATTGCFNICQIYNGPRRRSYCIFTDKKGLFFGNMDSEPSLRWGGYRKQYSMDQEVYCL